MAARSIAKRRSKSVDPEALYRKLRRRGALLSGPQVDELERALSDPREHMWRRAAFGTAMMSGRDLFGKIEADRGNAVVLAELAIGIRSYVERMRSLIDLVDAEQVRIELGLCAREDCAEVRDEAEKVRADENAFERFLWRAQGEHA